MRSCAMRSQAFFEREDSFALGVCNGCQMMSQLRDIVPGATHWPRFERNRRSSSKRASRWSKWSNRLPSCCAAWPARCMPIVVSHGEGRAVFDDKAQRKAAEVCLRYVDNRGRKTETYPMNPNGSPRGITGLTTPDGRFTIMMPHPERVFRAVQHSWRPDDWKGGNPIFRSTPRLTRTAAKA
jgi:phosphoribosylformylglycinamidine synthase